MLRIVCLLIGYCFGMFQTAYILGKSRGIDIRDHGSGNSGTTNAMRVMGTKAGLIVFFGDMFKAIFALVLVGLLFGKTHPEEIFLLKEYAFAGLVLGHDYPFYMKFRGGKGVAVMAGYVFAFHWSFIPVGLICFFVPFLLTHYVSLGSILVYSAVFIAMVIEGQLGVFAGMTQGLLLEMYIIQGILTFMAIYRHRANIGRLKAGTESRTYLKKH